MLAYNLCISPPPPVQRLRRHDLRATTSARNGQDSAAFSCAVHALARGTVLETMSSLASVRA
jgi:hypothetical protein